MYIIFQIALKLLPTYIYNSVSGEDLIRYFLYLMKYQEVKFQFALY